MPALYLLDHGAPIEHGPSEPVAVHSYQHLGVDLREPVESRPRTEVRGAARPYGADTGGGQHGDDGLRDVGQVGGHAVSGLHPEAPQRAGDESDLIAQLARRRSIVLHRSRPTAITASLSPTPWRRLSV